jgi:hypothetical protein
MQKNRNFSYAAAKKNAKLGWFTKANAFVNDGTATRKFIFDLVFLDSKYFL